MSDTLTILRDAVVLCDGDPAISDGVPLGDFERAMDVVKLPRSTTIFIIDFNTKTGTRKVRVYRKHATSAEAIRHAILSRQTSPMVADFTIQYDDGADIHAWTATGAAWNRIGPDRVVGLATWLDYDVTHGPFAYTIDDVVQPEYNDALNNIGGYLRPGGIYTYRRPTGGYSYLQP